MNLLCSPLSLSANDPLNIPPKNLFFAGNPVSSLPNIPLIFY